MPTSLILTARPFLAFLLPASLVSVWGHKYQGCGNIAECLVFGRIAAQTAMSEA